MAKGKPHREQEEIHQSGISDVDVRIGDFNFSRLGSTEIDILTVIRVKGKFQKYNLYVNDKLKHRMVGPDVVIATLCKNMQSMSEMVSIYETMKF